MMIAMHCHLTPPSAPAPLGLGANVATTLVLGVGSTAGRIKSGHLRFEGSKQAGSQILVLAPSHAATQKGPVESAKGSLNRPWAKSRSVPRRRSYLAKRRNERGRQLRRPPRAGFTYQPQFGFGTFAGDGGPVRADIPPNTNLAVLPGGSFSKRQPT